MTVTSGKDTSVGDTIAEDMAKLPAEVRKAVRPKLREAAALVANDAKRRASWSDRIPRTIRIGASFRQDREGIYVAAGGKNAPHARLFESVGGRDHFRHPVFKTAKRKKTAWVSQRTRPFLFPAARMHEARTSQLIFAALGEASQAIGFKG